MNIWTVVLTPDLNAQQRAALVTARLCRGDRLTTKQVAEMCGYADPSAAWRLLMNIAALHEYIALTCSAGAWYINSSDQC